MGFLSTLVSLYEGSNTLPKWFIDKHEGRLHFSNGSAISSSVSIKMYSSKVNLIEDYQKALVEIGFFDSNHDEMILAVLSEYGDVTKVVITQDSIKYYHLEQNEVPDESCRYYE